VKPGAMDALKMATECNLFTGSKIYHFFYNRSQMQNSALAKKALKTYINEKLLPSVSSTTASFT